MSCTTNRLRTHELLAPRRWGVALRVGWDLLGAQRRIERQPLERLCDGWDQVPFGRPSEQEKLETLECVRRYVNFYLGLLFSNRSRRCLPRSMVLYRWAGRLGMDVSLHLAMHRRGARRDGHSWIEIDGAPLFEPAAPKKNFVELYHYHHGRPVRQT